MDADVMRAKLDAALGQAMAEWGGPMRWGKDDCALWCANILRMALGYDAAASFRGRYRSCEGAQRVLGKGGLPEALRLAARAHGWERIEAERAEVGDIGLAEIGDTVSTMICRASGWFVGRSEAGWVAMPARGIRLAWKVVP